MEKVFKLYRKLFFDEKIPTQRNRYFKNIDDAIRLDGIEQGVLPFVLASKNIGAYPIFSCQGHPELCSDKLGKSGYCTLFIAEDTEDVLIPIFNSAMQLCVSVQRDHLK